MTARLAYQVNCLTGRNMGANDIAQAIEDTHKKLAEDKSIGAIVQAFPIQIIPVSNGLIILDQMLYEAL
jgi:hypothetical protein